MKKGVSLLALAVTIVVLGIVSSTVIITGANSSNNTKKMQFASEIISLQGQIKEAIVSEKLEECLEDVVYIDELVDRDFMQAANLEIMDSQNRIELYPINLSALGVEKISRGNKKEGALDIYLYSKKSGKVYYFLGYKISGMRYYTLSSDLDVKNSFTQNDYIPILENGSSQTLLEGLRVYDSSGSIITNESSIIYTVLVTNKENIAEVSISDSGYVTPLGIISTKKEMIHVYTITGNAVKDGVTINVNSFKDGVKKFTNYKLAQYDSYSPIIDTSKFSFIYYEGAGGMEVKLYLSEGAVVDRNNGNSNASGVKEIRYYFGAYPGSLEKLKKVSSIISGESITLNNTSAIPTICIYAEDKAGNATHVTLNVPDEIMNKIKQQ